MSLLDRAIAAVSPRVGLDRARARAAMQVMARYRSSDIERDSPGFRARGGDADASAISARRRLSYLSRDFARNNGLTERALQVITNNVVGSGIHSKLITDDEGLAKEYLARVRAQFDTCVVDHDGVNTLAGIQRMVVRAMVQDGECLIVWPDYATGRGDLRLRVLEADYLDDRLSGPIAANGNYVSEGVEYDRAGRVVAYHLFDEHPGAVFRTNLGASLSSTRHDASRVLHVYRVDRPGQRRGVSWFAPILADLAALADNDDAQMMRQKIAACFAVFWRSESADAEGAGIPQTLSPGLIQKIGSGDDVQFANPPDVTGYDDFGRVHLRRIAAGVGVTYEDLTGDLTQVNFSSARIGRMTFSQNIDAWQWTLVLPRLCAPVGQWGLRAWIYDDPSVARRLRDARLEWTPPPPVIADPKNEMQVVEKKLQLGLTSRRREIRALGYDAEDIDASIEADPMAQRFSTGPGAGSDPVGDLARDIIEGTSK